MVCKFAIVDVRTGVYHVSSNSKSLLEKLLESAYNSSYYRVVEILV